MYTMYKNPTPTPTTTHHPTQDMFIVSYFQGKHTKLAGKYLYIDTLKTHDFRPFSYLARHSVTNNFRQ